MRQPDTETMHIQLHGMDLAHLPSAGKLKRLIEFSTAWTRIFLSLVFTVFLVFSTVNTKDFFQKCGFSAISVSNTKEKQGKPLETPRNPCLSARQPRKDTHKHQGKKGGQKPERPRKKKPRKTRPRKATKEQGLKARGPKIHKKKPLGHTMLSSSSLSLSSETSTSEASLKRERIS